MHTGRNERCSAHCCHMSFSIFIRPAIWWRLNWQTFEGRARWQVGIMYGSNSKKWKSSSYFSLGSINAPFWSSTSSFSSSCDTSCVCRWEMGVFWWKKNEAGSCSCVRSVGEGEWMSLFYEFWDFIVDFKHSFEAARRRRFGFAWLDLARWYHQFQLLFLSFLFASFMSWVRWARLHCCCLYPP